MDPIEEIKVKERTLFCEGGSDGAMGHPRIYMVISEGIAVDCPYCRRRYILQAASQDSALDAETSG